MKLRKFKKIVEVEVRSRGFHSNNNKINLEEDCVDDDHNNIDLWQQPLNSWFDIYNEVSRNTARITEHWLKLFWNPWAATTENENNSSKERKGKCGISRI